MKSLTSQLMGVKNSRGKRQNMSMLALFLVFLFGLILIWSILFHIIMSWEGQEHTWITGMYWTLTVMSTLGFGDITFTTDIGRIFSICVLLSGTLFMLILLPVTFIEFFYQPWIEAQVAARAPTALPEDESGHVILVSHGIVNAELIRRLEPYHYSYALLVSDLNQALSLHDQGLDVVLGDPGDPETWTQLRVENAAMVATIGSDVFNTAVTSTVRGLNPTIPIITSARNADSIDVLQLAGATHVLQLAEMTGAAMARRTSSNALTHVVGSFDDLYIAEATAAETPMVGKTLLESGVRENTDCNVVGVWNRGKFEMATPDTRIHASTVLVIAGSQEQLKKYDEFFFIYHMSAAPVVIIGGGRVGRAVGRALHARDIDYRIVEMKPELIKDPEKYVQGNAADRAVLDSAGILKAPAVVITTHDDDLNVYLSIYCRGLRPDVQIVTRAVRERTVAALTRAGVDFVVSDASMGATTVFNLLRRNDIILVAEGLHVFRLEMPPSLIGKTIAESNIRQRVGCSVVSVRDNGETIINPGPSVMLNEGAEIALIGTVTAEDKFIAVFVDGDEKKAEAAPAVM